MRVFFCYILLFVVVGCSSKYGIHKSYAFTRKLMAGTIPVDENNKPLSSGVQKAHLVFIETKAGAGAPAWDTAWIDHEAFLVKPIKLGQDKIPLGKTIDGSIDVSIEAQRGNILWQLMLNPLQLSTKKSEDLIPSAPVVLSGLWKNKKVRYTIETQTELETIFGE